MQVLNLRTEYLTNPIGIDVKEPRFSWTLTGGLRQTAYQIVAKAADGAFLWDSGRVVSDQMHLIPWGGQPLGSRSEVHWTVKVWDEEGLPSEEASASFELGLCAPEDWKARWITGNYTVDPKKRYPVDVFCKDFEIPEDKLIVKARAYMAACGIYEGMLNGEKIGDFCLAPGITDYRKRVQCQTVDITNQIRNGKNTLSFQLADGWYRGSVGAWAMKNYYGSETKLIAQLEIQYADGLVEMIGTDDSFQWTNQGPIRFADNKDGEIYDARMEDLTNVTWEKAKCTAHPIVPTASNNFPLVEKERFTEPVPCVTPMGKHVLDFGQNIAGYIEFHLQAKEGQKLLLRFGELIDKAGEFTQKNIQCAKEKKNFRTPLQQIEYFCREGENHYKTRFAIFGFQYMQLEMFEADGTPVPLSEQQIADMSFAAIAVYSGFETTFRFDSSNELLNRFVANTLWSLKNNSADLPTDCPTRERHGWSGDAQIFVNTASYMVNYAPFALKYENDLCDWQTPDGNFPQIAPEGGTDSYMRAMNGSVGWSDAGVLIPYRLFKKYGDRKILETYYENMKKYAGYMIGRTKKTTLFISARTGLSKKDRKYLYNCGQHYGEWAEPGDIHKMNWKDFASSQPEVATAYLAYVMTVMTEIAEILGKSEDLPLFKEYAEGARYAYQKLVQQEKYSLDTDRQAKLVRPLYFGLLDEKQTAYAKKRLVKALENYCFRVGTGFLSTPLILYVLEAIDPELAYRLLENEEKPGWLSMPKNGASTIWEDWDGPDSDNGMGGGIASLNHYSKGAACEWIFERMCGIQIVGTNQFRIAPVPGGSFTYAALSYDSCYGTVSCSWKRTADGDIYELTIPANTSAEVVLPGRETLVMEAGTYIL